MGLRGGRGGEASLGSWSGQGSCSFWTGRYVPEVPNEAEGVDGGRVWSVQAMSTTDLLSNELSWRNDVALEIWVDGCGPSISIRLSGTLDDATAAILASLVVELIEEGGRHFSLDTKGVCLTDQRAHTTLAAALAEVRRLVQSGGGRLSRSTGWVSGDVTGLVGNDASGLPAEADHLLAPRSVTADIQSPEFARVQFDDLPVQAHPDRSFAQFLCFDGQFAFGDNEVEPSSPIAHIKGQAPNFGRK